MQLQKLFANLCAFAAIFSSAAGIPVLDTNGKPLESGPQYYIKPAIPGRGGDLTLVTRKNQRSPCPKYVGQVEKPEMKGTPINFTSNSEVHESTIIQITFQAPTSCPESRMWGLGENENRTSRKLIGMSPTLLVQSVFRIVDNNRLYHLLWCPDVLNCGMAGILGEEGVHLLALDGPALPFVFERVV